MSVEFKLVSVPDHVFEGIKSEYRLLLESNGFINLPHDQKLDALTSHHLHMVSVFFNVMSEQAKTDHNIDLSLGDGWTFDKDGVDKESMQ